MAGANEVKAGGAYVEIGGRDAQLDAALAAGRKKLEAFGRGAMDMGRKFVAVGALMAAPLVAGVKAAADFEQQMANVSTMLSGSGM